MLSTTSSAPASCATAASAAMSAMPSSGLVGVSTQMIFVLGRIAARTASDVGDLRRRVHSRPQRSRPWRTAGTCRRTRRPGSPRGRPAGTPSAAGCPRRPGRWRRRARAGRPPARPGTPGARRGSGSPERRVLVAQPGRADRVLRVRGGLVDRRDHRAGAGLGLLAGVDGERLEAVTHSGEASAPVPQDWNGTRAPGRGRAFRPGPACQPGADYRSAGRYGQDVQQSAGRSPGPVVATRRAVRRSATRPADPARARRPQHEAGQFGSVRPIDEHVRDESCRRRRSWCRRGRLDGGRVGTGGEDRAGRGDLGERERLHLVRGPAAV